MSPVATQRAERPDCAAERGADGAAHRPHLGRGKAEGRRKNAEGSRWRRGHRHCVPECLAAGPYRALKQPLRACLETTRGAAARDFGCGQGGEFRASPQRAVRNEPTPATDKRPAARRVFGEKAVWLRPARECFRSCSVVAARSASFVAPRHPAFSPKTAPLVVSKQALSDWGCPPDAQNHGSQF
jgi:hypothetical protein